MRGLCQESRPVKGMRRTFIGQKATITLQERLPKHIRGQDKLEPISGSDIAGGTQCFSVLRPFSNLTIAMSFFVRKRSDARLSHLSRDCNNRHQTEEFSSVHLCNGASCH